MNERGNQEWLKHLDLYIMVDRAIAHHKFYKLLGLKIGALLFGIGEYLRNTTTGTPKRVQIIPYLLDKLPVTDKINITRVQ